MPLPFHIDDHYFTHPEVMFEVLPRALRVIAPTAKPVSGVNYGIEVAR